MQRIRALPSETRLLVVDAETEAFYRGQDVIITGQMSNVLVMSSDDNKNNKNNSSGYSMDRDDDSNSVESANSNVSSEQHEKVGREKIK